MRTAVENRTPTIASLRSSGLSLIPTLLALLLFFHVPATLAAAELLVLAAASLTDSLKEIGRQYQAQSGQKVRFNFNASNLLARQIEHGAPADLFFSADEQWMTHLDKRGLLQHGTRHSPLSNSLVVILATDSSLKLTSASELAEPQFKRIALANPETVPAGIYAKQFFKERNLWDKLQRKIVPTENVRAALAAVESGNVDAGMVYKTDALMSRKVRVHCQIPAEQTPQIRYSVAVTAESKQPAAAQQFLQHLLSPQAARIFSQHGFIVRPASATP